MYVVQNQVVMLNNENSFYKERITKANNLRKKDTKFNTVKIGRKIKYETRRNCRHYQYNFHRYVQCIL